MIAKLVNIFFGCWHSNYSFPITTKSGKAPNAAQPRRTYVVCLDCGKEFAYDWRAMRLVTSPPAAARNSQFAINPVTNNNLG